MIDRIDRVEAILTIQQLVSRYAMAVDARDLDAWVNLFVPDVDCGKRGIGRVALKRFITPLVKHFYRSVHHITSHVIDIIDADNATGKVYCRAEHEERDRFIVMACCYFDTYKRVDGEWLFVRRDEKFFYSHDYLERPQDAAPDGRWPGDYSFTKPTLPQDFASWGRYWQDVSPEDVAQVTRHP